MFKFLCALIAFLTALQRKCENLLGQKQPKFTETSTPLKCVKSKCKVNSSNSHMCHCLVKLDYCYQTHPLLDIMVGQLIDSSRNTLFTKSATICEDNGDHLLMITRQIPQKLYPQKLVITDWTKHPIIVKLIIKLKISVWVEGNFGGHL